MDSAIKNIMIHMDPFYQNAPKKKYCWNKKNLLQIKYMNQ